jgi:hypothetical protein
VANWSWDEAGGAFAHFGGEFIAPDTPIAWDELDPAALDAGERERVRRAWVRRAHDEYRSMIAFAGLLGELGELAAPLDVLGCAARVVRDETRHVQLCARVATALGGPGDSPGEPRWVRSDPRLPARDRVAVTMLASMAIGESVSVAMIAAAREDTAHPVLRAVTTAILADESFHGRFGMAWVKRYWKELPFSLRLSLDNRLPRLFAELEREHVRNRPEVFARTMRDKIIPELCAAGVRADAAWQRRSA